METTINHHKAEKQGWPSKLLDYLFGAWGQASEDVAVKRKALPEALSIQPVSLALEPPKTTEIDLEIAQPALEEFDYRTGYEVLRESSNAPGSVVAVRSLTERLLSTDREMETFNRSRLESMEGQVDGILKRLDEGIRQLESNIRSIELENSNISSDEAKLMNEATKNRLIKARDFLLKEKTTISLYSEILCEVFLAVHKAKKERERSVNEVEVRLRELEKAESNARGADVLIRRVVVQVHLDRLEIEQAITAISPELTRMVQQAVDLHQDLILASSEFIDHSSQNLSHQEGELNALVAVLESQQEIMERVRQVESVAKLRELAHSAEPLDPETVRDLSDKVRKKLRGVVRGDILDEKEVMSSTVASENQGGVIKNALARGGIGGEAPEMAPSDPPGNTTIKPEDPGSPRWNECIIIFEYEGDSPQAASAISEILRQDKTFGS